MCLLYSTINHTPSTLQRFINCRLSNHKPAIFSPTRLGQTYNFQPQLTNPITILVLHFSPSYILPKLNLNRQIPSQLSSHRFTFHVPPNLQDTLQFSFFLAVTFNAAYFLIPSHAKTYSITLFLHVITSNAPCSRVSQFYSHAFRNSSTIWVQ